MVYRYTGKKRNGRYIETEIDTKQIAENAKMLRRRGNEHRIRTNLASKPFKKYCILKSDGMAQGWSQQPAERSRKSAKRKPNEAPNMKPKGAKMAPRKCGILPRIDREIKIQSGATKNDTKLHQMDPRGCQSHPNGSQLAPEGSQREPRGDLREPKGAQRKPKGNPKGAKLSQKEGHIASQNQSSDKVVKSSDFG